MIQKPGPGAKTQFQVIICRYISNLPVQRYEKPYCSICRKRYGKAENISVPVGGIGFTRKAQEANAAYKSRKDRHPDYPGRDFPPSCGELRCCFILSEKTSTKNNIACDKHKEYNSIGQGELHQDIFEINLTLVEPINLQLNIRFVLSIAGFTA